jgi:FkbM family methyltransferase
VLSVANKRFHGTARTVHQFSIEHEISTLGIGDASIRLPLSQRSAQEMRDWLITHPEDVLELEVFLKLANQACGLMFDVGADIGTFAAFFCKVSHHNAVCFEPVPHSQRLIEKTAKLNGLRDRIEVIPTALGDKIGAVIMHHDKSTGFAYPQNYRLSDASGVTKISAQVTTIDAVRSSAKGNLALVKIDVEGMEDEVLRGAAKTLDQERPVVLLEVHHDYLRQRGINAAKILSEIVEHGYSVMRLNGRPIPGRRSKWTILPRVHVLAVPKERRTYYADLLCPVSELGPLTPVL